MKTIVKNLVLKYLPKELLITLKKRHYAHSLSLFDDSEEPDLAIVKKLLNVGDFAIDIGANIGLYTKIMSEQVGKRGRIYCFEPLPSTFAILEYNINKLGLKNVTAYNLGLSNVQKKVRMSVPKYSAGGENYYRASIIADDELSVGSDSMRNVDVSTLDLIFAHNKNQIAFVKCDVEGHEWPLLQGANELLEKKNAAWLIEISGCPDMESSESRKIFDVFEAKNYLAYWYDGSNLKKRQVGDSSINYFFLNEKHIALLKLSGVSVCGL